MKIKRGDTVTVLTGKDKGKKGKVLKVFRAENRMIVEKINMVKKHQRPTQQQQQGGIVEKEAAIHISNIQLVCPKCSESIRPAKQKNSENESVRICRKCQEAV